jgi:hypothetical protein
MAHASAASPSIVGDPLPGSPGVLTPVTAFAGRATRRASPETKPDRIAQRTHRNVGSEGRPQASVVDRMWHNPNRIHAVQGPIVTLTAVRRRLP